MKRAFREAARDALNDQVLQHALTKTRGMFVVNRQKSVDALPEFEAIRAQAKSVREHTLANLGDYLRQFEAAAEKAGATVHWASSTDEANRIIVDLCEGVNAKRITKGKSMISEEMGLNHALEAAGLDVVETDLGEYIIQLADETPSHIIAPAVHKSKDEVEALFDAAHGKQLGKDRPREALVGEAREALRDQFVGADVGIIGANFLVADTGSTVLVTNEGNGDLTASLPDVHIVTASIDKVIPSLDDLPTFLRLLARSATGQEISSYTTLFTGVRQADDLDGPSQFHIVLLDNGRSDILGSEFEPALRCIRCGACMNHCAVYGAIGGHAYQSVYPGPIGQVMTPLLNGYEEAGDMIDACTMNGHCMAVCPMSIPLSDLIRLHRVKRNESQEKASASQRGFKAWAWLAKDAKRYQRFLSLFLPLAMLAKPIEPLLKGVPGIRNWLQDRDLPPMAKQSFQTQYRRAKKGRGQGS